MFKRLRTTWLAGGGALLLVLSLSGVVAGASFLAATGPAQETADPEVVVDTTATFEDTNGNGIDDDCEAAVVADPVAAAAAEAAADGNGDGVISVTEAAHSGRIGGKNCNHGGYVNSVAHGDDACEAPETTEPEVTDPGETDADAATEADEAVAEVPGAADADDDADETETDEPDADESEDCASASVDEEQGETVVSAAAKAAATAAAKEARKAEHDAAKAERKAAHDAAKAERAAAKAERAAAKAERQAAKAEKASKQKANGNGH